MSDERMRVVADGKLRGRQGFTADGEGIDHGVFRRAVGTLRAVMIGVDFPDAEGGEAEAGWRRVDDYAQFLVPGAARWFARSSFGRLKLSVDVLPDWHTMSRSHRDYRFDRGISFQDHKDYIVEGTGLAKDEFDLEQYDVVYLVPPRNATGIKFSPAFIDRQRTAEVHGTPLSHAVTFGQDMWRWGYKVLNHETGHILGLPDLYTYEPAGDPPNAHPHVGGYDLMGLISGHAPELMAWQKWRLGWLDDDQVTTRFAGSGRSQTELDPVEVPGGLKLLVLPTSDHEAYMVECRRPILHDAYARDHGVLIYRVDTHVRGGHGSVQIVRPDGGRFEPDDMDRGCFRADEPGRARFTDETARLAIEVAGHEADFDVVSVVWE